MVQGKNNSIIIFNIPNCTKAYHLTQTELSKEKQSIPFMIQNSRVNT